MLLQFHEKFQLDLNFEKNPISNKIVNTKSFRAKFESFIATIYRKITQPSLQNCRFFGVIQNAPEIKDIINLVDTKKNETFIIDFHVYLIPFESLHLYEFDGD